MARPTLSEADLAHFHGTEHWYRHGVIRNVLYTDGARYVADQAGAYWLLDAIAIAQACDRRVAAERFQVWGLVVHADQSATLTCEDGNAHGVAQQQIPFTDFPLSRLTLWCVDKVIMLPGEY
jgi:hypothetical protein